MTSSADQTVKLWEVETGVQLYSFNFEAPAKAVSFSEGDKMVVITTDPFMEQQSAIHVKIIEEDRSLRKCALFTLSFILVEQTLESHASRYLKTAVVINLKSR